MSNDSDPSEGHDMATVEKVLFRFTGELSKRIK